MEIKAANPEWSGVWFFYLSKIAARVNREIFERIPAEILKECYVNSCQNHREHY